MSKTVFRYFIDFLDGQEKWLNRMAERGYRLKKCGIMTYTFEECGPNEYEYAVEFVGDRSVSRAKDYRGYLEDVGYRAFTKNINLNFSYGKVKWRPYAKGLGQLATSPGGYNSELLILEKKRDEKPFALHTTVQDKRNTYQAVLHAYAWAVFAMLALTVVAFLPGESPPGAVTWVLRAAVLLFGVLFLIPAVKYFFLVRRLKEESKTFE